MFKSFKNQLIYIFLYFTLFNTDNLNKLTDNYVVNTSKINKYLNKTLLLTSRDGFIKTFQSFN